MKKKVTSSIDDALGNSTSSYENKDEQYVKQVKKQKTALKRHLQTYVDEDLYQRFCNYAEEDAMPLATFVRKLVIEYDRKRNNS